MWYYETGHTLQGKDFFIVCCNSSNLNFTLTSEDEAKNLATLLNHNDVT